MVVTLDRVRKKGSRTPDTWNRLKTSFQKQWHVRQFRKRPMSVLLNHPQVGPNGVNEEGGILDYSHVDTRHAHHDHEEQANAESG